MTKLFALVLTLFLISCQDIKNSINNASLTICYEHDGTYKDPLIQTICLNSFDKTALINDKIVASYKIQDEAFSIQFDGTTAIHNANYKFAEKCFYHVDNKKMKYCPINAIFGSTSYVLRKDVHNVGQVYPDSKDTLTVTFDTNISRHALKVPTYPEDAKLNGIEGYAEVRFFINNNGDVSQIDMSHIEASGGKYRMEFYRNAILASKEWNIYDAINTNLSNNVLRTIIKPGEWITLRVNYKLDSSKRLPGESLAEYAKRKRKVELFE